ncbi:MAG: formate dehydrogenase accessory sulfurtransferase FdhD [Candidatus Bathyarchaeia archaeon]
MSTTVKAERVEVSTGNRKTIEESVAMEVPVNIYVNDRYLITLLATPRLQRELALGWLFDEGVLQSFRDIEETAVNQNNVNVTTKESLQEERLQVIGVTRILTTACGLSISKFLKAMGETGRSFIKSDYKVRAGDVAKMAQELDDQSKLFRSTGGTHAAALFEKESLVAFAEDIGRHNAIDKVVGIALQSNVSFSKCTLVSSGRQPADMVLKVARMGIPILASKASPIRSGIIAARKTGVTLICFVRENRMNVYTYPSRVLT